MLNNCIQVNVDTNFNIQRKNYLNSLINMALLKDGSFCLKPSPSVDALFFHVNQNQKLNDYINRISHNSFFEIGNILTNPPL